MIYFVVKRGHEGGLTTYFRSMGANLAHRIEILSYDQLLTARTLATGTYVFCDIDRLYPDEAESAVEVAEQLHEIRARIVNHPTRSMQRYELLRTLHERGINTFDVYRVTEARWPRRFPVFLRRNSGHGFILTPLLHTREQLSAALDDLLRRGQNRDDILIVEFCDSADDRGTYYKFSTFVIGDRLIAHNIVFDRHWDVRGQGDPGDPDLMQMESNFVFTNAYAELLQEVCAVARIEYGRIDFGLLDGVPQIWEINTNPNFWGNEDRLWTGASESRNVSVQFSIRQMNAALEALDY